MTEAELSKLVKENTGLIAAVARRFYGRAESDDLFQLASVGFMKAANNFDPQKGALFSTYATAMMIGEIRRFLRDDGALKVSRSLKEKAAKVKAAEEFFIKEQGRSPTVSELSERSGMDAAEIASLSLPSLCSIDDDEDGGIKNLIPSPESEERIVDSIVLNDAVSKLPADEKKVISLRYGHGVTQVMAAKILGVSQTQISRLERKALMSLRFSLTG